MNSQNFSQRLTTSLANLKLNQTAIIVKVEASTKALRRRLLDMGLTKGALLKIKKIAPFGDPVDIEIRGYELCLRLEDIKQIIVEVVS